MITSTSNPKIQRIRHLLRDPEERASQRVFIVEGVRLLEEALASGSHPERVFISSTLSQRGLMLVQKCIDTGVEVEEVDERILTAISATENSQGILAIVPWLESNLPEAPDFMILVDGVRDPGNLGTILRTAAATGVQAVLLSPGSVDVYNPKVVRAGMGAHFRIPVVQGSWEDLRHILKPSKARMLNVIATCITPGKTIWETNFRQAICLMISSEAEGTSAEGDQLADDHTHIPMPGGTESLNAAVAAAVLMYEVLRQRQG